MFQGESAITIDDKGRLAIPTGYRDLVARECGNRLVITYNPFEAGSLYLYTLAVWERVRDQVNALPRTKQTSRMFQLKLVVLPRSASRTAAAASAFPPAIAMPPASRRRPCCWAWATNSSCGASRRTTPRSGRP